MTYHPPPTVNRTLSFRRIKGEGKAEVVPVALKMKYATQVTSRPPTFAVFANRSDGE